MKYRILLVDDDPTVTEVMALMLSDFDLVTVNSGDDAARILEGGNFHLLITDIRMPGLSGHGLIDRVARENPRIKIIAVSGGPIPEEKVEDGTLAGYLQKPFKRAEVVQLIRKILG